MNTLIPIITRRLQPAGNPGDALICLGLQWLLSQVIQSPKFLLIDKFVPDDFKLYESLIRAAGQIIYAGTPQYNNLDDWCLWYDWDMYASYIAIYDVKLHTVAGGSGYPSTSMGPRQFSRYCLDSKRTRDALLFKKSLTGLCTVRDFHAHQLLSDIGQKVCVLPCTALWSSQWLSIESVASKTVGLVAPSYANVAPELIGCKTHDEVVVWFCSYFLRLKETLHKLGYSTVLVCHGLKEYLVYKDLPIDVFYTNDLVSLVKMYGSLHGVISARLHGAIPVAGMQGKRSLLLGIDTRNSAADVIGIPKLLLGQDDSELAIERYLAGPDDYSTIMKASQVAYEELFHANLF
jgi:hypothetical protein